MNRQNSLTELGQPSPFPVRKARRLSNQFDQDSEPMDHEMEMQEVSNFFIDVLKDDFCERDAEGWYTFKEIQTAFDQAATNDQDFEMEADEQEVVPIQQQPKAEPEQKQSESVEPQPPSKEEENSGSTGELSHHAEGSPEMKLGPWSPDEHALFLESLKMYGKDWEAIQRHIKTRDVKIIRAHAQKFLKLLVKLLERKSQRLQLTDKEAEFYFGILNKKIHKSTKMELEHARAHKLWEESGLAGEQHSGAKSVRSVLSDKPSENNQFENWKEARSEKVGSEMSLGHSVKFRDNNSVRSFKPMFEANWEALSNNLSQFDAGSINSSMSQAGLSGKACKMAFLFSQQGLQNVRKNEATFQKFKSHIAAIEEAFSGEEDYSIEEWKKRTSFDPGEGNDLMNFCGSINNKNFKMFIKAIVLQGQDMTSAKPNLFMAIMEMIQNHVDMPIYPYVQLQIKNNQAFTCSLPGLIQQQAQAQKNAMSAEQLEQTMVDDVPSNFRMTKESMEYVFNRLEDSYQNAEDTAASELSEPYCCRQSYMPNRMPGDYTQDPERNFVISPSNPAQNQLVNNLNIDDNRSDSYWLGQRVEPQPDEVMAEDCLATKQQPSQPFPNQNQEQKSNDFTFQKEFQVPSATGDPLTIQQQTQGFQFGGLPDFQTLPDGQLGQPTGFPAQQQHAGGAVYNYVTINNFNIGDPPKN